MAKNKAVVKYKTLTPEERNHKNLMALKKSLIKICKKRAKEGNLKNINDLFSLINSIDDMLHKPIVYFDLYNYLRIRRFDEDIDINDDDIKYFDEVFGGEVDA